MAWPSELQRIIASAEKQGCKVLLAEIGPGDHMSHRARIVVEKNGAKVLNSGQGSINADGFFEFGMRLGGPITEDEWQQMQPAVKSPIGDETKALLEEAMHALLYIDAHMETERVPVAKKIAEHIGHPWPPYPDAKDEDDEEDYENPGAHGTPGGPDL